MKYLLVSGAYGVCIYIFLQMLNLKVELKYTNVIEINGIG